MFVGGVLSGLLDCAVCLLIVLAGNFFVGLLRLFVRLLWLRDLYCFAGCLCF